ncbi:MAG: RNA 3'-terminal phosphate cyclase, partial [Candidatus Micrarchaeota archaeon]
RLKIWMCLHSFYHQINEAHILSIIRCHIGSGRNAHGPWRSQVDKHLADQILVYAALASGRSRFKTSTLTMHIKTNAYIISKFIERKIALEENNEIRVE